MSGITISQINTISLEGCVTQAFYYFLFGTVEFFILAIMALDRYVVISIPLRYLTIMRIQVCLKMIIASWVRELLYNLLPSIATIKLPFCGPNIMDHFFCDTAPMLQLVYSDLQLVEMVHFICSAVLLLNSLFFTLTPYIFIVFLKNCLKKKTLSHALILRKPLICLGHAMNGVLQTLCTAMEKVFMQYTTFASVLTHFSII